MELRRPVGVYCGQRPGCSATPTSAAWGRSIWRLCTAWQQFRRCFGLFLTWHCNSGRKMRFPCIVDASLQENVSFRRRRPGSPAISTGRASIARDQPRHSWSTSARAARWSVAGTAESFLQLSLSLQSRTEGARARATRGPSGIFGERHVIRSAHRPHPLFRT
jgi:hypothetical protein